MRSYESAIKNYMAFHDKSIEELICEARHDEEKQIPLKNRKIKKRLLEYRNYLFKNIESQYTIKTYFTKVKTFYSHFDIEIPNLPDAKYNRNYETNYLDLPTREHIKQALDIVSIDLKSIILFMSSSGTAKAETLSLSVEDFISATQEYHSGGSIEDVLDELSLKDNIIPTFYLKRLKTDKFYYTFCSPEATTAIVKYLKTRMNLNPDDPLFDFTHHSLLHKFQEINDAMGWGFKGKYRFFRTHALRKFHASNINLSSDYIDALQGRTKNEVHEAYIKTNPEKLKEIYASVMQNVMINVDEVKVKNQEFTIMINIFLSGKEYNIM